MSPNILYLLNQIGFIEFFIIELVPKILIVHAERTYLRTGTVNYRNSYAVINYRFSRGWVNRRGMDTGRRPPVEW